MVQNQLQAQATVLKLMERRATYVGGLDSPGQARHQSRGLYPGQQWRHVWQDRKLRDDWSDRWKLTQTDDQVAFRIEVASSSFALDSGDVAKNGLDPWLWDSHWEPWQQWIIVRLPLT